jgi:exocyst complex component 7
VASPFAVKHDTIPLCDNDTDIFGTSVWCRHELLTQHLYKIKDKSRLYDDDGLQNMNNLYYMVQKVMDSQPLRDLLGNGWLCRHHGQIRQYEVGYKCVSWIAVLSDLRDDSEAPSASAAVHRAVIKPFNAAFEEMYWTS